MPTDISEFFRLYSEEFTRSYVDAMEKMMFGTIEPKTINPNFKHYVEAEKRILE